jgi:hypothetical protein
VGEVERLGKNADVIGGGIAEPGFGIDGASEMVVEIAAFGHASEEGTQSERASGARLLHVGCGLLLRRTDLHTGLGWRGKKLKQNGKQQSKLREAGQRTLHARHGSRWR